MSKKMLFNASAALVFSVGLSVVSYAQESTPTPMPTPVESPSPSPSPMMTPTPAPSPSPMMPTPTPTPVETTPASLPAPATTPEVVAVPVPVPVAVEKPKTAEAVTNVTGNQVGEKKAMTETVASTYDVPLLNVPSFGEKTTEINVKFAGELEGLKGKAYITRHKDGVSRIKMRFDDMKMAPKQKRYVLWAVAPDKSYTKIGQVINSGEKQEGEVRGETNLKDFGLFVTMEDDEVTNPTGKVYAPFGSGGL